MTTIQQAIDPEVVAKMQAIAKATPAKVEPKKAKKAKAPKPASVFIPERVAAAPPAPTKEYRTVDLNNIMDADLGAAIKAGITAELAEALPEKRKAALAVEADRIMTQQIGIEAEQERRKGHVLSAFMVGTTLEIPALDLAAVSNLDEQPDSTMRSPYNKARYRLCQEGPLPVPDKDLGILQEGEVPTTYRVLAVEHERLRGLAKAHNESRREAQAKHVDLLTSEPPKKAKKAKKAKAKAEPVLEPVVEVCSFALGRGLYCTEPSQSEHTHPDRKQVKVLAQQDGDKKAKRLAKLMGVDIDVARKVLATSY